jgi:acyl-coenzyme A synthetase/AMP-(fatty) acid ligase
MALTKSFKDLVHRRVSEDSAFAAALLREGVDTMLAGDVDAGKLQMRSEIVEAMRGLHKVGAVSGGELEKTTLRMLGKDALPKV